MAKYTACICEGAAERAIIDLLLDKKKLIFEREDLIADCQPKRPPVPYLAASL